jgi:hypothetical protein
MFLTSKDGIICDFCGIIYKNEFVYYGVTSTQIKLINNIRSTITKGRLDADMCSNCYDNLLIKVQNQLGIFKRGFIRCDLSGKYESGTFAYHMLLFDRINVDKSKLDSVIVDKKVMDLSLLEPFDNFIKQVEVTRRKAREEGQWS